MAIEQDITELVRTANNLTDVVDSKIDDIDNKLNAGISGLEDWKTNAFTSPEAINNVMEGCVKPVDLRHLSSSLFYPMIIHGGSANKTNEYEVSRYYAAGGVELAGLFLKFSFVGHTWGGNPVTIVIHRNEQTYRITAGALGLANYYHPVVFLRGGYWYQLSANSPDVKFKIYETITEYYTNTTNPEYNSSVGPVDEAAATGSLGGLTVGPDYNVVFTRGIGRLGS